MSLDNMEFEARVLKDMAKIIDFGPRYEGEVHSEQEPAMPDDGGSESEFIDFSVAGSHVLNTPQRFFG